MMKLQMRETLLRLQDLRRITKQCKNQECLYQLLKYSCSLKMCNQCYNSHSEKEFNTLSNESKLPRTQIAFS